MVGPQERRLSGLNIEFEATFLYSQDLIAGILPTREFIDLRCHPTHIGVLTDIMGRLRHSIGVLFGMSNSVLTKHVLTQISEGVTDIVIVFIGLIRGAPRGIEFPVISAQLFKKHLATLITGEKK